MMPQPTTSSKTWRERWRRRMIIGSSVVLALVVLVTVLSAVFGESSSPAPSSAPPPAATQPDDRAQPQRPLTLREKTEACLDPWDGHHNGFEDFIRPLLNNEDSMETHRTAFGTTEIAPGEVQLVMEYSAENAFGGRVKAVATGRLNVDTCVVSVTSTGLD